MTRLLVVICLLWAGCARCGADPQPTDDVGSGVVDMQQSESDAASTDTSDTPDAGDTRDVTADAGADLVDAYDGPVAPTVELASVANCSDADPPVRCSTDVAQWGAAALLTNLTLEGDADEPICCVDVTGDGEIDNSAGMNLAAFASLRSTNDRIATSLERGDRAVVLELVQSGDRTDLLWWPAEWHPEMTEFTSPNRALVQRAAIDAGTQSRFWLPDVGVTADGELAADAGFIELPFVFSTVPVQVDAHVLRAEAYVVEEPDSEGFSIQGWLQLAAPISELRAGFDELAAERCDCLGLRGESMFNAEGHCGEWVDSATCTTPAQEICVRVEQACATLLAAKLFADLDLDGDGRADAMSAGFSFEAAPAIIEGITP